MTSAVATFSRPFICCTSPVHWLYRWLGSLTGAGEICPYSVQKLYSYRQVAAEGLVRIGELSRRTGVSPELLRAWERRYRLLRPRRTDGGTRTYSATDEARVRLMLRYLDDGLPPAQAAEMVTATRLSVRPGQTAGSIPPAEVAKAHVEMHASLDRFDETSAQRALERLFGTYPA